MELVLEPLVKPASSTIAGARPRRRWAGSLAFATLVASGCANHNDRAAAYLDALEAGRWNEAVSAARRSDASGPERNAVIDALELGTVEAIDGKWTASDSTLGRAWGLMEAQGEPGDPKFLDNLAAIAVNDRALDYIGGSTDRTMCATLRAMDLLGAGDPVNARVELKRAQFAQEDAEARYQERIEKARGKMEKKESGLRSVEESSDFKTASDDAWGDLESRFTPYRGWTVPFTDWLTAILLIVDGADGGDRNRAIDLLRRVGGTVGPMPAIQSDLALAESRGARSPQVWVVLGSGLAPVREEVVFRLPAFIPEMPFIGVAFPKLVQSPFGPIEAHVEVDGAPRTLDEICDMGSVIAHEFKADLPLITGRAIGAALAKAAASLAANIAARNSGNDWALLATMVATNVYGYSTTLADLRTWRTLPRAWSVARLARPDSGIVRLGGGIGNQEVSLPGDGDVMIIARAIRAGGPVSIHAFPLEPADSESVDPSPRADTANGETS